MNFIKNLAIIIFTAGFLYYFKFNSVVQGGMIYRRLYKIQYLNDHLVNNVKTRVFFETPLYFVVIIGFALLFKWISKFYELDKVIMLTIVVSPLVFEISGLLYDKSCLKPWYHFNVFLWYFPMRLVLWAILYWVFKDLFPLLKQKRNIVIIGCVFLLFHFAKIYSRYNF